MNEANGNAFPLVVYDKGLPILGPGVLKNGYRPILSRYTFPSRILRSRIVISSWTDMTKRAIVLAKRVDSRILVLRGQRVILDTDLAELYGVESRHLNQQVKRNAKRFPIQFRFQISSQESKILRSQNVISSEGHGGRRYRPYAFTEHGAIMAATVLNSERAIEMSVFVVLAFVRMRQALAANRQIAAKLTELENRLESHDADIQDLMNTLRELMAPLPQNPRRIGFDLPSGSLRSYRTRSLSIVRRS